MRLKAGPLHETDQSGLPAGPSRVASNFIAFNLIVLSSNGSDDTGNPTNFLVEN